MSLLSFTADFSSLVSVLGEIAALLRRLVEAAERLSPVLPDTSGSPPVYQAQPSDLRVGDFQAAEDEKRGRDWWAREFFGVMPDSEAFDACLVAFETERRRVHPNEQIDWPKVFREAGTLAAARR